MWFSAFPFLRFSKRWANNRGKSSQRLNALLSGRREQKIVAVIRRVPKTRASLFLVAQRIEFRQRPQTIRRKKGTRVAEVFQKCENVLHGVLPQMAGFAFKEQRGLMTRE